MTLSEFKAWFEGFTESMAGAPDEKQWERIKSRVKEIDGVAITKTVYVDRYYPPYRGYFDGTPFWLGGQLIAANAIFEAENALNKAKAANEEFSSHCAMIDLGKAEYSAVVNGH